MGVVHQTGVIAVTAGEGDGPDAATLAAALAGTPAITYGTTNASGSASTLVQTDAQLKYPAALMSAANSTTLTLTDDGTQEFITGSLGNLNIEGGPGGVLQFESDDTAINTANIRVNGFSGSTRVGLQTLYNAVDLTSASTVAGWNVNMSHSKNLVSSTIIGYNMSTFSFSPSASSDTANFAYGAKLLGPLINNATGGWTEVAALSLTAPRRLIQNPTVTAAYTTVLDCPTVSSTIQVGVYIKQRTAQTTATNRYGVLCDSHNSGTNRWSYWGSNKIHCDKSDFIANASAFGFCNRDSQSSSAGGGGTARYWRMFTDASATGVSGDVTIAIDSAGNMTATRAGGAAGTVLLKLVDVGTAAVTT